MRICVSLHRLGEGRTFGFKAALEFRPRPPRHPAIRGGLKHAFNQAEVVAESVERGVRAVGRAEDRQPVAVRDQAVTRWTKREVALPRQGDSERAPIQSAVEETEAARVDIAEDAAVVQDREVERQSLDVGGGPADLRRGTPGAHVDGSLLAARCLNRQPP